MTTATQTQAKYNLLLSSPDKAVRATGHYLRTLFVEAAEFLPTMAERVAAWEAADF